MPRGPKSLRGGGTVSNHTTCTVARTTRYQSTGTMTKSAVDAFRSCIGIGLLLTTWKDMKFQEFAAAHVSLLLRHQQYSGTPGAIFRTRADEGLLLPLRGGVILVDEHFFPSVGDKVAYSATLSGYTVACLAKESLLHPCDAGNGMGLFLSRRYQVRHVTAHPLSYDFCMWHPVQYS
ncbi:hypothetical protein BDY19DRAFT_219601 [Irpex rosettiformis]|uniref:Uncharacterized protein n=1 Tax=Irpex rosettiformis TaxID=378272 RepID=A0ACB8U070_9APHY|nr:hypothetical protein BDY19DRAFT_219601 [Irpex rosettiformis]